MKKLLVYLPLAFALTAGAPLADAWEREAFKAIKDIAREQVKQEKAAKEEAAREQAEKERAEREEQERAAKEQAEREQAERDRAESERAEQAAKEQAKREQERAREQAERERAKREQERQQAERQKWEQERRKWEQERRQWEQERQQAEQADSDPQADPAPAEQADNTPQDDIDKAERERAEREAKEQAQRERAAKEEAAREQAQREQAEKEQAERERVEQAGGTSCYGVALIEYAFNKGLIGVSNQKAEVEAKLADLKKNCYGDPNEPPADFQEDIGPRHCHKPMMAKELQEEILMDLRDAEAADAEKEKKRQAMEKAAEKRFDALFYEAAEAGCIAKEAMDAFHAEKAERERAARDRAWCEQNYDRRTSDMNCFEMEKTYDCREAAWITAVDRRTEANAKMRTARQTADAADPESMAAFDRVQAEREAAHRQADLAKKRGQEVIYDGVKNNCPTEYWDMHPGFVDEQFAQRILLLKKRMNR